MSVPETVAKIAVDNAAFYFDKPFSYKIPPALREEVAPGARVTVPFGRGNKRRSGLVLELCQEEDTSRCKEIASVYDRELCENEELFKLVFYLRETTFCTYYDAAKAILPAGVGITIKEYFLLREELLPPALTPRQQSAVEALRARRGRLLCADLLAATGWKPDARELRELLECGALERDYQNRRRYGGDQITWAKAISFTGKLTPKQKAVYDWLCTREEGATLKELLYQTGVGRTVVDNLKKKGALALFERESYREVFDVAGPVSYTHLGPSYPAPWSGVAQGAFSRAACKPQLLLPGGKMTWMLGRGKADRQSPAEKGQSVGSLGCTQASLRT